VIFSKDSKLLFFIIGMCGFVILMQCAPTLQRPAVSLNETQWQVIPRVLENNFNKLETLKGQGKLIVETVDVSYNANAQIIFKNPDSVLIKVEAIFGIDVGSLFADRNAFKVYVPSHNTCYWGKSESIAKNQLIAFSMNYDRLIQSVTGLNKADAISKGILRRVGETLILYGKENSNLIKYWIDPQLGVVTKSETRDSQNRLLLSEEYSRFVKTNGVVVPKTIRIKRPIEKESFTLFYETIRANPKVQAKDFVIRVPKNAHKIML
jgi:outer membrane lipoprotein-sorting protein